MGVERQGGWEYGDRERDDGSGETGRMGVGRQRDREREDGSRGMSAVETTQDKWTQLMRCL